MHGGRRQLVRRSGGLTGEPRSGAAVRLSVVIPTLGEERDLPALLGDLARLSVAHEVIVADGGSADGTALVAAAHGARVVSSERGRGRQLAEGARAAAGEVLFFVHADARLGSGALAALARVAEQGAPAPAAFRLRITAPGAALRLVEFGANTRARLARLPYGDQGLIISRRDYDAVGGYRPLSLMEDVAMSLAFARRGGVCILPESIDASPRRWERDGVLRRTVRNWTLLAAYLSGADPERLARFYMSHSSAGRPRGTL